MDLVFVYGTLKKGRGNHGLLRDAEYIGQFSTIDNKWGLIELGAFPGMIPADNNVVGEVYRVSKETLASLDRLEGTDHGMYARVGITVRALDQRQRIKVLDVWAYQYMIGVSPIWNARHDTVSEW